ncbi:MAG: hypothetical protein G01um10143_700 [Parcubacteria group bacterium Gr01-1014_3]|nr:MAG: hypothetical protein G01um10143_700 [Parcubacteria group bacterium Gr01-1014_3]
MNKEEFAQKAAPFFIFLVLAIIFQFSTVRILDTDSFYHIKHSWVYLQEGIFQSDFPWTQYSMVNALSSDIWYGFHILSIPFAAMGDLLDGMKFGGIFVTFAALSLVYLAIERLNIRWPFLWVLLFYFASADLLYRLNMFRPHPISLGLTLLIFAYLVGENSRKSQWIVFGSSLAFSWIHLSLSWVPIFIALVITGVRFLQKENLELSRLMAMGVGLAAGLFLRPNPVGAGGLAYVQVVKFFLEKQNDIPLRFGRELTPFVWENFIDQLWPIAMLLLVALVYMGWLLLKNDRWTLPVAHRTAIWTSLIIWAAFAVLTFTVARRSNEIFVAFGVLFIGLLFTHYQNIANEIRQISAAAWQNSVVVIVAIILLCYMPIKTLYRYDTYIDNAFAPAAFQDSMTWLKLNAKPREIVFNIHWDRFAQFFFWNENNYYINGMDPIFGYSFDPALHWKNHFLAIDKATDRTCGEIRCTEEMTESTYDVLTKDFKASYIVVEKRRNPRLHDYLETAQGFEKAFDNVSETIYKIVPITKKVEAKPKV